MRFNLASSGAILLVLMCCPFDTANADELSPAWYVGGGAGASWLDPVTSNPTYSFGDDQDFAWQLFGGYRINQSFSVEFGYADLGGVDVVSSGTPVGDIQYRQTTLGMLWSPTMKPDSSWRSFLKAGVNYSDPSWDQGVLVIDDWGGFAGVGLEKLFGDSSLAWRAEYTAYAKDAQTVSVSLVMHFSD